MDESLNDSIINISQDEADICAKAFVLGFGEYEIKDDIAEVYLASDLKEYVDVLNQKTEDEIYTKIETFDDRVGRLMQLYCVIELEELYKIYKKRMIRNKEKGILSICLLARKNE